MTQFGSPPRAVSGAPTAPRRPVRDAATRTASSKADARSARMDPAAVDASRTRHARSPSARSYKPPRRDPAKRSWRRSARTTTIALAKSRDKSALQVASRASEPAPKHLPSIYSVTVAATLTDPTALLANCHRALSRLQAPKMHATSSPPSSLIKVCVNRAFVPLSDLSVKIGNQLQI